MTNLEFRSFLNPTVLSSGRTRRIIGGNSYGYRDARPTSIRYVVGDREMPYVMSYSSLHPENILHVSHYYQWSSSSTIDRMKDIADSAMMPIPISIISNHMRLRYLVGKGFIATWDNNSDIKLLFVACKPAHIPNTRLIMRDITFYISKKINNPDTPKKIKAIVQDFAESHPGDVLYTNDIDRFIGHNIRYPPFSSISQKKEHTGKLIDFCTEKMRKSL